jgi:hypothetical protein
MLMRSRSKGAGKPNGCINRKVLQQPMRPAGITNRGRRLFPASQVYFVFCETTQRIKCGLAANPVGRLRELQVGSPTRLRLLGSVGGGLQRERRLHRLLAAHHVHGEWFYYNAAVRAALLSEEASLNLPAIIPDPP